MSFGHFSRAYNRDVNLPTSLRIAFLVPRSLHVGCRLQSDASVYRFMPVICDGPVHVLASSTLSLSPPRRQVSRQGPGDACMAAGVDIDYEEMWHADCSTIHGTCGTLSVIVLGKDRDREETG